MATMIILPDNPMSVKNQIDLKIKYKMAGVPFLLVVRVFSVSQFVT